MTHSVPEAGREARAEILDFLLESGTWRTGLLSVLLDAVSAAVEGGPVVVLGVTDERVGRLWVGAVSMLSAPSSAEAIRCRHADGREEVRDGAHLVTVSTANLHLWAGSDGVVIGEDDNCSLGEMSIDPHQTERGTSVAVTHWSLLAEAVLVDSETALAAFELQESIDRKFAADTLHRLWPLAMTVASTPEMHESMSSAAEVIREHSPWALVEQTELFSLAVGAVAGGCGRDAAVAWRDRLTAGPTPEPAVHVPDPLIRLPEPVQAPTPNPAVAQPEIRTLLMGEAADLSADTVRLGCSVSWTQPRSSPLEVDLVAFLLDESRTVSTDEDFVFYNSPVGGGGAVALSVLTPEAQRVDIDFGALAPRYHRVALGIVITGPGSFSQLNPLRIVLTDNEVPVADSICTHGTTEQAMIVGEFYIRAGRWRARSVWQGYDGGLAALATSYGVVVDGPG
ncbi:TerD family protein [Rhodococcus sp. KBS0724]|jgi:stress response protein SCP2|uniref:TerD family protein n=1 Tax=Rhodococcus sp. KBS0724 TaxID=1179674 RepID=UPI00110E9019|nr:TerD family protein [Rhodococcus sp. KBS0724]TSD46264.1 TerD family protein [Rhodococcus sp. KBS0724]